MSNSKDYARVLFMLAGLGILALWIQANSDFKAGSVYMGMLVMGFIGYSSWDAIIGRGK